MRVCTTRQQRYEIILNFDFCVLNLFHVLPHQAVGVDAFAYERLT